MRKKMEKPEDVVTSQDQKEPIQMMPRIKIDRAASGAKIKCGDCKREIAETEPRYHYSVPEEDYETYKCPDCAAKHLASILNLTGLYDYSDPNDD
jgi:DNA-directed RNA polymerase subunit RPC12/RpoP